MVLLERSDSDFGGVKRGTAQQESEIQPDGVIVSTLLVKTNEGNLRYILRPPVNPRLLDSCKRGTRSLFYNTSLTQHILPCT